METSMHRYQSSMTPRRGSESGNSECVQALSFIAPPSQQLGYGDTFEDTTSECHFFANEPTELEDSGDEDWVPKIENSGWSKVVFARDLKSRGEAFERSLTSKIYAEKAITSDPSQFVVRSTSAESEATNSQHPQFASRDSEEISIPSRIPPPSPTEVPKPYLTKSPSEDLNTIFEHPVSVSSVSEQAFSRSEKGQATTRMTSRGRPEYRQAILGSSKSRKSFPRENEEGISVSSQARKRNECHAAHESSAAANHIYASDDDAVVEATIVKQRKGRSAQDPLEISSGDETHKIPSDNGERPKRQATPRHTSTKLGIEKPVASLNSGRSKHITVDLTMLPTSDSSGSSSDESSTEDTSDDESDSILCIGESNQVGLQLEAANKQLGKPRSTTTRNGNHKSDSSDSNEGNPAPTAEQDTTSAVSLHVVNTEAKSSYEPRTHENQQATIPPQTTSFSLWATGDDGQGTAVNELDTGAANSDFELPELEIFHSHEAPLPFSLKREEELARAKDESTRLEHEAANHQRWLNGEPYVPFPEPATKDELTLADERKSQARAGRRKLSRLARETIRTCTRDGITPRLIRRQTHESDICFAARLLRFKESGWKDRVAATRRRHIRRARLTRAALVCAGELEDEELRKEVFGCETPDKMMTGPY